MLIAVGLFLVLLFLGMPVAFAIGISGLFFCILTPGLPWTILVQKAFSTTQSFTMLAIPLFIFAGNLMNNTGITHENNTHIHARMIKFCFSSLVIL